MKKTILFSLAVLALGACTRETGDGPADGRAVDFTIVPQVAETVTSGVTRARVDGAFGVDSRVGLSIASTTSPSAIHPMYGNFFAMFNGTSWGYYLDNVYNGTLLSGFASWGNISVMGYYPYDPTVTNLAAIPFSIADMTGPNTAQTTEDRAAVDYMVAGAQTLDMADGGGPVSLEFDHIMTSLSLRIVRSYQGPLLRLSRVRFKISDGQGFVIAGTYDATGTSDLDIAERAQTIDIVYTSPGMDIPYGTNKEIPLLILPELKATGSSDATTVTVTFFFNDADGDPYKFDNHVGNPSLSFTLGEVTNGAGGEGLLAGYNYVLRAEVGTYIHFGGAPKVVLKDNEDVEGEHIEI